MSAAGGGMEKNVFSFIWRYSKKQQMVLVLLAVINMPVTFFGYTLIEKIVNEGLQGFRKADVEQVVDGETVKRYAGIKADGNGVMNTEEYDQAILDLVNYLEYTGEPTRLQSEAIGRGALIFVLIFFIFAYLLKKEYWRGLK